MLMATTKQQSPWRPHHLSAREKALEPGPHWHVVHTEAKAEAVAKRMLEREGYEHYQPMFRRLVTPPRKTVSRGQRRHLHLLAREVLVPLFPRYLFVRFDAQHDPWHDLFRMVGVHGIVCAGGMPYPVRDEVIEKFRALELNGAIPLGTPVRSVLYAIGDEVRVKTGPFAGFAGTIEQVDDAGRVLLLMSLFGRKVRVEMADDYIGRA